MLGSREAALAVAKALAELPAGTPIVLDPVMVAESGAALLDDDARQALIEDVIPLASVLTPNLPEAMELVGHPPAPGNDEALAHQVLALGCGAVVLTGGHRDVAVDLFLEAGEGAEVVEIHGPRHPDGAAHGSGCTHSSVLAAQLALGHTPLQAARRARQITGEAVRNGLRDIGQGAGPVDVLDLRARR
jgi:hydroxymethylpyrimidine/phosphomethylpyrimidine kinase